MESDPIYAVTPFMLELIDETGQVVWAARYKAWGRVLRYDKRDVEQPLRFQGQYEDQETGLFYNRYRYYDPDQARYITQDAIKLAGSLNLYSYAANSVGWVDPLGLTATGGKTCPKTCCTIVIGEDQDNRVVPAAKALGAQQIKSDWPKALFFNPYIPGKHEAVSMEFNRQWINKKMDDGCTILDPAPVQRIS